MFPLLELPSLRRQNVFTAVVLLEVIFLLIGRYLDRNVEAIPSETDDHLFLIGMNVVLLEGALCGILIGAAFYTEVDLIDLGFSDLYLSDLVGGILLGLALSAVNIASIHAVNAIGLNYDERLREVLTPKSISGWVFLVVVILPVVAVFEEVLFRGALIGVLSYTLEIGVPAMVLLSTTVFAVIHTTGWGGILIAGVLGIALDVSFVATGSLIVVVTAHYTVNLIEFVIYKYE